jgi:hypothetical protein
MEVERVFLALLHWPVYDRKGNVIATALTTIDIHDLGRLCKTYGLGGVYIVTPLSSQIELGERMVKYWREGPGASFNPLRKLALENVRFSPTLEDVVSDLQAKFQQRPTMIATSAKRWPKAIGYKALKEEMRKGGLFLLIFGTGWGLTRELIMSCDMVLEPIEGKGYNHLSVRTAAAIIIDRLFGRC